MGTIFRWGTICLGELLYGSSLTLLTAAPRCAGSPALCLGRPSWERPSASVAEFTHTHTAAEKQKHFQLMHKGVIPGTGPCRDRRHDGRSVASTGTDGSSSNRKRSASSAKMDLSDDDSKPLFPDSDTDGDAQSDRRKSNRANTRQSK